MQIYFKSCRSSAALQRHCSTGDMLSSEQEDKCTNIAYNRIKKKKGENLNVSQQENGYTKMV